MCVGKMSIATLQSPCWTRISKHMYTVDFDLLFGWSMAFFRFVRNVLPKTANYRRMSFCYTATSGCNNYHSYWVMRKNARVYIIQLFKFYSYRLCAILQCFFHFFFHSLQSYIVRMYVWTYIAVIVYGANGQGDTTHQFFHFNNRVGNLKMFVLRI